MKKVIIASLALLIILILSSCSQEFLTAKDKAFNELIQIPDMNKSMRLTLWSIKENGRLRIGNDVNLAAINNTKNNIVFPTDYGISILVFDETTNKWIDIPNYAYYSPPGKRILFPKTEDDAGITGIGVNPKISSSGQPIALRIVVRGETRSWIPFVNKKVGAYIDLILQP
jgi:hypothetical protein